MKKIQCKKYQFKSKINYFLGDLNFLNKEDRIFFIGFVPEKEYGDALKSIFQNLEKSAKQIATAGGLKIKRVGSVSTRISAKQAASDANPASVYPVNQVAYPRSYIPTNVVASDWEPALQSGELRFGTLSQLQQFLNLTVRYEIE